ncbi:MAG: lipopolysaccharide kinase InaA family protein [Planctomycetota bacterium]
MSRILHRSHNFDRIRLQVTAGFGDAWLMEMWNQCVSGTTDRILRWQIPANDGQKDTAAYVKIYRKRPSHRLLKRILPSRALREGNGYLEFARRGIKTVPLIAWGEERRWGLWQQGVVVTAAIEAKTVEQEFTINKDPDLLMKTAQQLAQIHEADLAHGDPLARNFLATVDAPTPFDLPSWSQRTARSQSKDLIRFLGSILTLTGSQKMTRTLLSCYREKMNDLPLSTEDLLGKAEDYSRKKQA